MFGLEGDKKKKNEEFVFDLENDLKDSKLGREIKETAAGRIKEVKAVLRNGKNKEDFDKFGILLHGYTSLQKVLARVNKKR